MEIQLKVNWIWLQSASTSRVCEIWANFKHCETCRRWTNKQEKQSYGTSSESNLNCSLPHRYTTFTQLWIENHKLTLLINHADMHNLLQLETNVNFWAFERTEWSNSNEEVPIASITAEIAFCFQDFEWNYVNTLLFFHFFSQISWHLPEKLLKTACFSGTYCNDFFWYNSGRLWEKIFHKRAQKILVHGFWPKFCRKLTFS